MSLFSIVDEALKSCEAEEAKINEKIHQCREILRALRPQKKDSKETQLRDNVEKDPGVPPEEIQEMELLERVLEKALRVRSGTTRPKEPHSCTEPNKVAGDAAKKGKDSTQASVKTKGIRSISKPTKERKECTKSTVSSSSRGGRQKTGHHRGEDKASMVRGYVQKQLVVSSKGLPLRSSWKTKQAVPGPTVHDQGQPQASIAQLEVSKASATFPHEESVSVSHKEGAGKAHLSLPQNETPSQLLSKWSKLRQKQSRLWDEVLSVQSKPVAERTHFLERVTARFPRDWPKGSPADTRAQVDRLAWQCHDLNHCYQAELLQAHQTSRTPGTEPGGAAYKEREYESFLMMEGLEKMRRDLLKRADRLREESKAWDRWRPGEGDVCPIRRKDEWGDTVSPTLPPTLTYSSEAELRELERLRLSVVLLQQEIHLHQDLSDALSPCISAMFSARKCSSPAMLRDMYSLLCEGGERFPSIVLDTEPDTGTEKE